MEIKAISFFGCSCGEKGDAHYDDAFEVAKTVAKTGRTVVNGGGPGVMLASTLGAKAGKGKTTVVYYRPELASNFIEGSSSNLADESFEESNYIMRTKKLLELSDAYIIFNGGTGTLSEFAMAWGVARLYIDHHKPLILYGDFWHHLMEDFKHHMLIRKEEQKVYTIVNSASGVLKALDKYEKIIEENRHTHKTCKGPECSLLL